jgi:hypothetical protein
MTLTTEELERRLVKAEKEMKELTGRRETLRIRIYRYRKALKTFKELDITNL